MSVKTTTRYSTSIDESGEGSVTITDIATGDHLIYTSDHPDFQEIVVKLEEGETLEGIRAGFPEVILQKLSEHVALIDGVLHYKSKPLDSQMARTVKRYYEEGRPYEGLAKFLERVENNPSRHSREQLWTWTEKAGLKVDDEGYIIGHKAVEQNDFSRGSGGAYVDGEWVDGHVPNKVGTVISMDRRDVDDDITVGCSHGLHVGTLGYARNFIQGGKVLLVRVDPADVVSVPKNERQKMRCSRYEILDIYSPEVDPEPAPVRETQKASDRIGLFVPGGFLSRLRQKLTGNDE